MPSRIRPGSLSTSPCRPPPDRTAHGGSRTHRATAIATNPVQPASAGNATSSPARSVATGSTAAARASPSGVAVCRMPMANPRRSAGNQVGTARPPAAFAPDIPTPTSANPATTAPSSAASARHPAAPNPPMAMTSRSPRRSPAAPRGTRVGMVPGNRAAQHPDLRRRQPAAAA